MTTADAAVNANPNSNADTKPASKAAKVKVASVKKKVASSAAVIPMVNAKAKLVFLKIVKANADKSIVAALAAVEAKNLSYFDGDAKTFVKDHGFDAIHVWKSRVAQVQPSRVAKSAQNQIDFWSRNGYKVVNEADFVAAANQVAADAKASTTVDTASSKTPEPAANENGADNEKPAAGAAA